MWAKTCKGCKATLGPGAPRGPRLELFCYAQALVQNQQCHKKGHGAPCRSRQPPGCQIYSWKSEIGTFSLTVLLLPASAALQISCRLLAARTVSGSRASSRLPRAQLALQLQHLGMVKKIPWHCLSGMKTISGKRCVTCK